MRFDNGELQWSSFKFVGNITFDTALQVMEKRLENKLEKVDFSFLRRRNITVQRVDHMQASFRIEVYATSPSFPDFKIDLMGIEGQLIQQDEDQTIVQGNHFIRSISMLLGLIFFCIALVIMAVMVATQNFDTFMFIWASIGIVIPVLNFLKMRKMQQELMRIVKANFHAGSPERI